METGSEAELLAVFRSTLFSLQMQQNADSGREEGRESNNCSLSSLNRVRLRRLLMTHILSGPREGKTQIYENTEERLFVVPGVKKAADKEFKQQKIKSNYLRSASDNGCQQALKAGGITADYQASGSFSYSRRKRIKIWNTRRRTQLHHCNV